MGRHDTWEARAWVLGARIFVIHATAANGSQPRRRTQCYDGAGAIFFDEGLFGVAIARPGPTTAAGIGFRQGRDSARAGALRELRDLPAASPMAFNSEHSMW